MEGAAAADAAAALRPDVAAPAGAAAAQAADGETVDGFREFVRWAREAAAVGAVHVSELTGADWQGLLSWPMLRPLQQRRVMGLLG